MAPVLHGLLMAAAMIGIAAAGAPVSAATLEPDRLPGMCLSMTGPDGQAESRECNGGPLQDLVVPVTTGPIRHAGQCLVPHGGGAYPELFPTDCDGSVGQDWTFGARGEIRNVAGQCLAVLGLSSRTGERIYAGDCSAGVGAQSWHRPRSPRPYRNVAGSLEATKRPGWCVTWIEAGSFIGLAPCEDTAAQRFSFNRGDFGHWRSKGGCLSGFGHGATLNIRACETGRSELWLLRSDGRLVDGFGQCAEATEEGGGILIRMESCRKVGWQVWSFRNSR
ncbi:MAG: ricin-type beta-trefoil lectin domain protein [Caulobacter sp.]|nr:ricin-type beta-trefoil lectin domain protein [Caulobacter sp.]